MPIALPQLDDRSFDDLVAEALARIPALAPEWTDHNPSDPGITLVELFAYLSDILIYRLDQVTQANTRAFLKLLNGPAWLPSDDLQADVRSSVQSLRRTDRAVSPQDFELLARAASPELARCACVPRRDLTVASEVAADADAPGHVSVVLLPRSGKSTSDAAMRALLTTVADYLQPRRLLTTRVHVVPPRWVKFGLSLTLWLAADALADTVLARAIAALQRYFDPLTGGSQGQGWPFGRAIYVSDIYRLLDAVPGVDYVEAGGDALRFDAASGRRIEAESHQLVGMRLAADELPDPAFDLAGLLTASQKKV